MAGAFVAVPVMNVSADPVKVGGEAVISANMVKASCPWWVANGYWRVIWYWGTGQCR